MTISLPVVPGCNPALPVPVMAERGSRAGHQNSTSRDVLTADVFNVSVLLRGIEPERVHRKWRGSRTVVRLDTRCHRWRQTGLDLVIAGGKGSESSSIVGGPSRRIDR